MSDNNLRLPLSPLTLTSTLNEENIISTAASVSRLSEIENSLASGPSTSTSRYENENEAASSSGIENENLRAAAQSSSRIDRDRSSLNLVSPYDISPVPKKIRKTSNRGRKAAVASVITSSPYKDDLMEKNKNKIANEQKTNKNKKGKAQKKKEYKWRTLGSVLELWAHNDCARPEFDTWICDFCK
ncbi:unnamed protein product [Colias eurytheme]|nr:unnamed protein product [Colias eurytheme]